MSDIVEQLRQASLNQSDYRWQAADEIERLRAEGDKARARGDKLRMALEDIAYGNPLHNEDDLLAIARAALNEWPGMSQLEENDSASIREMAALILPLPKETRDDE